MGALSLPGAPAPGTTLYAMADLGDPQTRSFEFGAGAQRFAMFIVRRGESVEGWLNRCPHAGHPLDFPEHQVLTPDKARLRCASHGAEFEFGSGTCIAGPCIGRALVPVPVILEDGLIKVGQDECNSDESKNDGP